MAPRKKPPKKERDLTAEIDFVRDLLLDIADKQGENADAATQIATQIHQATRDVAGRTQVLYYLGDFLASQEDTRKAILMQ